MQFEKDFKWGLATASIQVEGAYNQDGRSESIWDNPSDGRVDDKQRSEYITNYLRYVKKAKEENIPVQGYIYWSYIDNFEWQDGYKPRFGLVHCDYDNGCKRTIKDSAYTYKHIIETNGEEL